MKKWLGFSLLTIFLSVTGWGTYTFFIKDYEITDQEVDNIVDDDFDIELPEENDTVSQTDSISSEQNNTNKNESSNNETQQNKKTSTSEPQNKKTSSSSTSTENSDNKGNKPNNSSNENNETEQSVVDNEQKDTSQNNLESKNPSSQEEQKNTSEETNSTDNNQTDTLTVQQIKDKYKPSFNALQQQAQSKLNGLISYAYNEYKKKRENGEKVSYGYFYNKYTNAADRLEAKTDRSFNQLYSSMQNMLVQNGHGKDEASEVKAYYEEQKKARENALMDKVLKIF